MLSIVDDNYDLLARNNYDVDDENVVNMNLEQTMNKTLQRKWHDESSTEKILNTNPSNHNHTNANTLNGFQSVKNRNETVSMGGRINDGFTYDRDDSDNEVNDGWDDDDASGAQSIATDQQSMISITNRHERYNRPTGNRNSRNINNNNNNNNKVQQWSNDRHHQGSHSQFESARLTKTQCETTGQSLL